MENQKGVENRYKKNRNTGYYLDKLHKKMYWVNFLKKGKKYEKNL